MIGCDDVATYRTGGDGSLQFVDVGEVGNISPCFIIKRFIVHIIVRVDNCSIFIVYEQVDKVLSWYNILGRLFLLCIMPLYLVE